MTETTPAYKVQPALLAGMTEKGYQQQIVDAARRLGWMVYHTYDSRRSEPGFPDLVLVRGGRLLMAEIKRHRGRVTAAQHGWIVALIRAGMEVYVWEPKHWDTVLELLQERGGE